MSVFTQHYKIDTDWGGTRYVGLLLDWDYGNMIVHLSMPVYIEQAMVQFGHKPPAKPQLQPYPHTKPVYGAKIQYAMPADNSEPATKEEDKFYTASHRDIIILRKSSRLDITGDSQHISIDAIKTDQAYGKVGDMATRLRGNKSRSNTNVQEKRHDIGGV